MAYRGIAFRKIALLSLHATVPNGIHELYRKLRDKWGVAGSKLNSMEGSLLTLMDQETAREFLANKRSRRKASLAQEGVYDDQVIHSRNFTTGCLSFGHEVSAQRAFSKTVELRSPFSDRRLIEFALQMPTEAKLSIPWYKYILRQALAGKLPESVRWRRDLWQHPGWRFNKRLISEARRQFPEELFFGPSSVLQNRWFDATKVNRALQEYNRSTDFVVGYNLLVLFVLVKWLKVRPCMAESLQ